MNSRLPWLMMRCRLDPYGWVSSWSLKSHRRIDSIVAPPFLILGTPPPFDDVSRDLPYFGVSVQRSHIMGAVDARNQQRRDLVPVWR